MAKLAFCDYHNMVTILEKTEHNTDFHQIVDHLEASHISLQRQHSLMEERIQSQDIEITQLKTRVKTLQDNEKRREGFAQEDAPNTRGMDPEEDLSDGDKSADKGSDSTDEMSHVLGSLGAADILVSRGLRSAFTTASLSVATASTGISPAIATASGSFPTAVIFTTASVATPTTRVTRSSRGVVIGSLSLISVNILYISKKDKEKEKMIEPKQPNQISREQAERDYEIAMIHAEKELEMMIAELDRSNEMIAKYLSEYEQALVGLSHDEKVELINELLMYQRHLAQIKKYQAQQNKPTTKTERRNFSMSILRSNTGWKGKDFKGMTFEQIKEIFISVWEKIKDFVPMNFKLESERLKRPRIQLDKEKIKKLKTAEASEVIDEKAKELWVELKRLYEPNSRDPLWDLQRYMYDPLVWRLYDTCGVHHVSTGRRHQIFMLVEKGYPLTKGLTTLMLPNKLQVRSFPLLEYIPNVRLSVPTVDVYIAKKLATVEDFALLHEDKIYSESKTRVCYI
nr:hypothetical protein [Tanacetum cinerariifolium]